MVAVQVEKLLNAREVFGIVVRHHTVGVVAVAMHVLRMDVLRELKIAALLYFDDRHGMRS